MQSHKYIIINPLLLSCLCALCVVWWCGVCHVLVCSECQHGNLQEVQHTGTAQGLLQNAMALSTILVRERRFGSFSC